MNLPPPKRVFEGHTPLSQTGKTRFFWHKLQHAYNQLFIYLLNFCLLKPNILIIHYAYIIYIKRKPIDLHLLIFY
nr:MAG TPA: hypothetical protein [Caudoviricetes sp.]